MSSSANLEARLAASPAYQSRTMRGALLIATAVLVVLTSCSKKEGDEEADVPPLVTVQTATVTRGPIQQVITSEAVLSPVDQSAVTAKISAPVQKFFVNRGSHVTKGQLLATLENRDLQGALA